MKKLLIGLVALVSISSFADELNLIKKDLIVNGYSFSCSAHFEDLSKIKEKSEIIAGDKVLIVPFYRSRELCLFYTTESKYRSFDNGYDKGFFYGGLQSKLRIPQNSYQAMGYDHGYYNEEYLLNTNDKKVFKDSMLDKNRRMIFPRDLNDLFLLSKKRKKDYVSEYYEALLKMIGL